MPRILEETTNFLRLYKHAAGKSEVPIEFHTWGALSAIAACVADRVTYRKLPWDVLHPNLYTFLVGPAGCGKGTAMGMVQRVMQRAVRANLYSGELNDASLIKKLARMSKQTEDDQVGARMYLMQEELASALGQGPLAEGFVKRMVELWKPSDIIREKETITGGRLKITGGFAMNWIAGTTMTWMVKAIPVDFYDGGLARRIIPVIGSYDPTYRCYEPDTPEDYAEVINHLQDRCHLLTYVQGEMRMSQEAKAIDKQWYETRPAPTDEADLATWKGQHDLILKCAMCISLAEGEEELVIRPQHIVLAQQLTNGVVPHMRRIVETSHGMSSSEVKGLTDLEAKLLAAGGLGLSRPQLFAWGSKRGLNERRVLLLLNQLAKEKRLYSRKTLNGGTNYVLVVKQTPNKIGERKDNEEDKDGNV